MNNKMDTAVHDVVDIVWKAIRELCGVTDAEAQIRLVDSVCANLRLHRPVYEMSRMYRDQQSIRRETESKYDIIFDEDIRVTLDKADPVDASRKMVARLVGAGITPDVMTDVINALGRSSWPMPSVFITKTIESLEEAHKMYVYPKEAAGCHLH